MKKLCLLAAVALLAFGMGAQAAITIDTVTVGDPGNVADPYLHSGNHNGQGAVSYTYNIGKYEVTAGQYCAFLNAVAKTDTYGLYNINMADAVSLRGCNIQRTGTSGSYSYSVVSDWANRPVNYVSFWDACRFTNWLGNGQKTGAQDATTTERGTYTLDGYTGSDGRTIQRNAGCSWAVTSEDEWYKAAYYKGGGTNAGYWLYPTQSDTISTGMANYGRLYPSTTTDAGSYPYSSAYGTFDQGGNVYEWNETIVNISGNFTRRGWRGGAFSWTATNMQSLDFGYYSPDGEFDILGFRVVQSIVPEPSSILALLGGLAGFIGLRRRKA